MLGVWPCRTKAGDDSEQISVIMQNRLSVYSSTETLAEIV
jgi:hypothetical protein